MTPENAKEADVVQRTVQTLIDRGSAYDVEALERIYHPEFLIVQVDAAGNASTMDKPASLEMFRRLRDGGAAPLSREAEFKHVAVQGDLADVVVARRMRLGGGPSRRVFSIHLVRDGGRWRVLRETAVVLPDAPE